ncbi:MAG TPA: enolase C-terminal domain-like protein, partial [Planctomycetaceae bacterium]|nr:enolase C-terminal domain-like protein [Planctomycetaceae bacterium]
MIGAGEENLMRILEVREKTISVSRYTDRFLGSNGLNTTAVAVITDARRDGAPVVGFGFASVGRYGQGGLIRERFAPRLLAAAPDALAAAAGDNLDPIRAWELMMADEKPGGHGERSVAVGTLDMALWDAAAKIAGEPLSRFLGRVIGRSLDFAAVPVYAGGGYYYPANDIGRLTEEIRQLRDGGYTHFKIKIGGRALREDVARVEAVLGLVPGGEHLAVDAMNRYSPENAAVAVASLASYRLRWLE